MTGIQTTTLLLVLGSIGAPLGVAWLPVTLPGLRYIAPLTAVMALGAVAWAVTRFRAGDFESLIAVFMCVAMVTGCIVGVTVETLRRVNVNKAAQKGEKT